VTELWTPLQPTGERLHRLQGDETATELICLCRGFLLARCVRRQQQVRA
jgi:hypothetical protein